MKKLGFSSLGSILEEPLVSLEACRTILHAIASLSRIRALL